MSQAASIRSPSTPMRFTDVVTDAPAGSTGAVSVRAVDGRTRLRCLFPMNLAARLRVPDSVGVDVVEHDANAMLSVMARVPATPDVRRGRRVWPSRADGRRSRLRGLSVQSEGDDLIGRLGDWLVELAVDHEQAPACDLGCGQHPIGVGGALADELGRRGVAVESQRGDDSGEVAHDGQVPPRSTRPSALVRSASPVSIWVEPPEARSKRQSMPTLPWATIEGSCGPVRRRCRRG